MVFAFALADVFHATRAWEDPAAVAVQRDAEHAVSRVEGLLDAARMPRVHVDHHHALEDWRPLSRRSLGPLLAQQL